MARFLIADDHALFRAGLRALVEEIPGASVVAEVTRGDAVLSALRAHTPDVLLLDHAMPGISGLELISRADFPNACRVLILTGIRSEATIAEAVASRALAVVSKNDAPEVLRQGIEAVVAGDNFYSPQIEQLAAKAGKLAELTPRELQVLRLVGSGLRNKEIARQLELAIKTVDAHRTNLMRKLDAHSAAELMDFAITMGLREDN